MGCSPLFGRGRQEQDGIKSTIDYGIGVTASRRLGVSACRTEYYESVHRMADFPPGRSAYCSGITRLLGVGPTRSTWDGGFLTYSEYATSRSTYGTYEVIVKPRSEKMSQV
jgi:hypothetical protein